MSVYVDFLIDYGWKLGPSCHLTADTVEELNTFALSIGMKLAWLQTSAGGVPHYDLVKRRRDAAIKKGAIEFKTRQEAIDQWNKIKIPLNTTTNG